MVSESFNRTTPQERSAAALAYILLTLNFAALSTSTITATNVLFDIVSAPSFQDIMSALRDEASNVLRESSGVWTKASVAKLHRLDSIIRESLRVSGFSGTGLTRRVKAADGITLENGVWVPKGATISVVQRAIHLDERFYGPRAREFDAFRFSRPNELLSEGSKPEEAVVEMEKDEAVSRKPRRKEDLVTTSPHFLSFGHGVHAWSVCCQFHISLHADLSLLMSALVASSLPIN